MKRSSCITIAIAVVISVFLFANLSHAREIKGKTKSFSRHLVASAVATDGSAVTGPVTVLRSKQEPPGRLLYIGSYSLQVPEGQKVMMVYQKERANGKLKPMTVAQFATDSSGLTRTKQLTVTAALAGGSTAIDLGGIRVKGKLAPPSLNPLTEGDNTNDDTTDQ